MGAHAVYIHHKGGGLSPPPPSDILYEKSLARIGFRIIPCEQFLKNYKHILKVLAERLIHFTDTSLMYWCRAKSLEPKTANVTFLIS